jgi:hypothetical protein
MAEELAESPGALRELGTVGSSPNGLYVGYVGDGDGSGWYVADSVGRNFGGKRGVGMAAALDDLGRDESSDVAGRLSSRSAER